MILKIKMISDTNSKETCDMVEFEKLFNEMFKNYEIIAEIIFL